MVDLRGLDTSEATGRTPSRGATTGMARHRTTPGLAAGIHGKTEPFHNVDLAVVRRFRWGTKTVDARLEAFNVFNATNFDEYVGVLSSPLFARPVSAFPMAQLQLGAVVRF